MAKTKKAQIVADADDATAMQQYAALYGLTMEDLMRRMWLLFTTLEQVQAKVFPAAIQDTYVGWRISSPKRGDMRHE